MRSESELKEIVAKNISDFRKKSGLTQAQLAEKINYSDKSVSKWERAEALPDLYVLELIADALGAEAPNFLCEQSGKSGRLSSMGNKRQRILITALSVGLVLLVTAIERLVFGILGITEAYPIIICAALVCGAIVLTVFCCLWFSLWAKAVSVSLTVWTAAFGVWRCVMLDGMAAIFCVAAVLEVLVVLWFLLMKIKRQKHIN